LAGVKQAPGGANACGSLYLASGTYLTASNIQYETCPNPTLSPEGRPAVILAGTNISFRDSNIFTEYANSIAIEVDYTAVAYPQHGSILVENIRLTSHPTGSTGDFKTLIRVKTGLDPSRPYVEWNRNNSEDGGLYLKRWTPSGIDVAGRRTSSNQHYAQQQTQFVGTIAALGSVSIDHSLFLRSIEANNYSAGSYLITVSARNGSNGAASGALIFLSYACSIGTPISLSSSVLHGSTNWTASWNVATGLMKLTNLLNDSMAEVMIVSHQQDFKSAMIG
jgi:hypothetical protein